MKIKLETKTNKKVEQSIRELKDGYVKIGWFEGQKEPNGLLVAENAYMQNKGFTITHRNGKKTTVLPRPFMQITATRKEKQWNDFWKEEYKKVADKRISLKQALDKLGLFVKTAIQNTILTSDGIRPNKPSTIEAKKRKGSPLIPLLDSKTMFNTINYKSEVSK